MIILQPTNFTDVRLSTGGEGSSDTLDTQRIKFHRRGAGAVPPVRTAGPPARRARHRPQERPHAMVCRHEPANEMHKVSSDSSK